MNLSNKSKEILEALWQLKTSLSQIMPEDLCDYIVNLIAKDQAHEKYLNLTKE